MIYIYFGSYRQTNSSMWQKPWKNPVVFPHPLRFRLVVHRKLCLSFWLSSPILKVKLAGRYLGEKTHRSVGTKTHGLHGL